MLDRLQRLGADEDSSFFKNWLRAQHAESIRSKQKDAQPGDFELAADAYHRWVENNSTKIGLISSDHYYSLIQTRLPFFETYYSTCLKGENKFSGDYPALYFNGARDLTLQSMLVLSALDTSDSKPVAEVKIKLVSHYLDCYATYRFINRQDNTYNNLRDPIFELVKIIRRKPVTELVVLLEKSFDTFAKSPISFTGISYHTDTPMALHLLGRIAHYLEVQLELTNKVGFPAYIQRKKSNSTFDVEHLLPANISITKTELGADYDFASDEEHKTLRNSFGALILLSRGRNRSLKDKPFSQKRDAYATEAVLAQTFCDSFYANNPQAQGHIDRLGLDLAPMAFINKASIQRREALYNQIAQDIWGKSHLKRIASSVVSA